MLAHIQILRFLAAAAVVAFHVWGIAPSHIEVPENTPSFGLWHFGHGVDLFFVISGFIIYYAVQASAARGKPLLPSTFLRRRVERIVPLYFVAILAMTSLAALLPAVYAAPGWYTSDHVLKSLAFISFMDGRMPVVFVGWSLEYEMYFYLALALLMVLTQNTWLAVVVTFCGLVMVGQIPGATDMLGSYAFFTDPLILEFIYGVIVGFLFVNGVNRIHRPGMMLFVTACATGALLATNPGNRAILYGLPSAALVAAAAWMSRARLKLSWTERKLERLGDASFSIYLVQAPLLAVTVKSVVALIPQIHPLALVVVASAMMIAAGFALSVMVERPLVALCRNIGKQRAGRETNANLRLSMKAFPHRSRGIRSAVEVLEN